MVPFSWSNKIPFIKSSIFIKGKGRSKEKIVQGKGSSKGLQGGHQGRGYIKGVLKENFIKDIFTLGKHFID